ncbi:MAG: CoA-binding [Rhodoferax sp.]|nr:CoA-binding [Rhodoferax sp.]
MSPSEPTDAYAALAEDLRYVINPKSIAVVGASDNVDKLGGRCLQYLKKFGFQGRIFPINPARTETQGVRTYASFDALPETAEVAVIALPGAQAVDAVEQCARHGTRVVVILTAGFGETDEAGKAQERRMVAIARAAGMRLIGPNTQGVSNFQNGAIANFSTMFVETTPRDGPVAIVSQSGGGSSVPFGLLIERGIGVRYCHAIGNQCDVTVSELALATARDPEVKLLLLYLEGIPDANHIAELGAVARARSLPVLVVKSGRTPAGQRASLSHTGSLATEDRIVDAFLAHHGLLRVDGMEEMVQAAELYLRGWKPLGRRLVVISNSGTACVLTADAATRVDMAINELQPGTRAELAKVLPGFASTVNPVDITAALLSNSRLFGDILPIIARDPGADVFLISVPVAGRGYDVDAFARDAAAFAASTGKPVVVIAPQPKVAGLFKAAGLPVFPLESQGVAALAQFIQLHETLDRAREGRGPGRTPVIEPRPASSRQQVLNEADGLALVAAHGVPTVAYQLCRSEDEVVAARRVLGWPVAIKGCTSAVTHKSDIGLVHLDVADDDQARASWRAINQAAGNAGVALDGVLVAKMARGRREMILGAHRDPTFGAVITVGDGGKYVEQLPDFQLCMANATRAEFGRAVRHLRIAPIFAGVRGEAAMDVEALVDALLALGKLMTQTPEIASIDLNPVILYDLGNGCLAVDSVIVKDLA